MKLHDGNGWILVSRAVDPCKKLYLGGGKLLAGSRLSNTQIFKDKFEFIEFLGVADPFKSLDYHVFLGGGTGEVKSDNIGNFKMQKLGSGLVVQRFPFGWMV